MKFQIDLNPYPGAPYFTVQEHLRSSGNKGHPDTYLRNVEHQLRKLFNIPKEFSFRILGIAEKNDFNSQFETIIIKDDAVLGIDRLATESEHAARPILLDLSFSFPQVPARINAFDVVAIDPNASLGVPSGLLLIFHQDDLNFFASSTRVAESEKFHKDLYILSKVVDDLAEKGREMLLRESNYKAAVLYHLIENHQQLKPIAEKNLRSKVIITAACGHQFSTKIKQLGYTISTRDDNGNIIISIANYATHSKELIEMFADRIMLL